MSYKTVTLDDGGPCQVRVLTLYELDNVPFEDPGEYQHTYPNGQTKTYTLRDGPDGEPEKPPGLEELAEHGSLHWAMWRRWNLYQAVLAHRLKQIEATDRHAHEVAKYILAHCISPEDYPRVTPGDLSKILQAALVTEVGMEAIETALAVTFPGLVQWQEYFEGFTQAPARRGRGRQHATVGSADAAGVAAD
jgi:hypothetical protein